MTPASRMYDASFRGTRFEVEKFADGTPRIFDVKTFPRRDGSRLGDDGLGTREITVEARIDGWADAAGQAEAFRAAMLAAGTGPLILPTARIAAAGCTRCEQNFEAAKIGQLRFKLTFVADDENIGLPDLGILASTISSLAGRLRAALPGILTPVGVSPYFTAGVESGLATAATAAGAVSQAPVAARLPALIDVAASLAVAGGAVSLSAAERLAR